MRAPAASARGEAHEVHDVRAIFSRRSPPLKKRARAFSGLERSDGARGLGEAAGAGARGDEIVRVVHSTGITGVVCGVRVETIEDPPMREIRYLDKLIDELARGKKMEKILREA